MMKTIFTTLTLATLSMSSSFADTTILDCHVEGWQQNDFEIKTNAETAMFIMEERLFREAKGQLSIGNTKSNLEVSINRYAHKNLCMVYTYMTGDDFSVKNDPCGHKRIFTGEFKGDKVSCVLNSL